MGFNSYIKLVSQKSFDEAHSFINMECRIIGG